MVLIRPKSPERSDVDLSWFKDTERSRVMVMDMKSRVCEANRKPTESRRTVAVYRNDSDVITSPRAGSDVRRIFNERKTGERTVMAAKMMTPFLNRLETYIPKQSWFKPNPIVDRLVGLTLHCFVLSMFVLSGLMVKALASICNFLLYVLADMAVERGRVPVLPLSRDEIRRSSFCRIGKFGLILGCASSKEKLQQHQQQPLYHKLARPDPHHDIKDSGLNLTDSPQQLIHTEAESPKRPNITTNAPDDGYISTSTSFLPVPAAAIPSIDYLSFSSVDEFNLTPVVFADMEWDKDDGSTMSNDSFDLPNFNDIQQSIE